MITQRKTGMFAAMLAIMASILAACTSAGDDTQAGGRPAISAL